MSDFATNNGSGAIKLVIRARGQGGLGTKGSCVFGPEGGTIGRGHDNNWVLFDPRNEVSSLHARIVNEGGEFCLIDESTNGVFVNRAAKPIGRGVKVILQHGDLVRIGQYEMVVQAKSGLVAVGIEENAEDEWRGIADLFETPTSGAGLDGGDPRYESVTDDLVAREELDLRSSVRSPLDPLAAFDRPVRSAGTSARRAVSAGTGILAGAIPSGRFSEEDAAGSVGSHVQLQAVLDSEEGDMDAYLDELARAGRAANPVLSAREPPEQIRPQDESARKGISAIETEMSVLSPQNRNLWPLLEGLGFTATPIPDEAVPGFLRDVGAALRQAIAGLNDAYGARSQTATPGFRVAVSKLQPFEDNPIKSAEDVDRALNLMFSSRSLVHLGPEDAIRECLDGLRLHQDAVAAGTAAGLRAVIDSFSPETLSRRFAKYGGDVNDLGWLWEMFVQYSKQIGFDKSHGLCRLFEEVCQQAYDRHVWDVGTTDRH